MSITKNISKWFKDKASAFRTALQAGRAHDFAVAKANRRPKKKSMVERKPAYVPGSGSLSAVSQAIRKDYGTILSRKERRAHAKTYGIPFKAYYNG